MRGQGESSSVFNEALLESSNCSVEPGLPNLSNVSRSESRSASYFDNRSLSPEPDKVDLSLIHGGTSSGA